ncbi:MAG TPA: SusC/RagA family TonB-linked outer membrane protein, partial [Bacteroidales bacterium]|nr:SusC/RagA family TonB-linked outer membrane protein [Bacteroidales bacterium]
FWSLAGGWTISEESFFNVAWIDQLKLRTSYGTNGNRGVGIYDALSDLGTGKFVMITNGTPGYTSLLYTNRMANSSLKWERTSAFNVGLDLAVLKGRIRANIEGYYMITKDLLIPRQLPNITGYASVMANLGQVDNKGIELTLNSINIGTKDFTWSTDLSMAHNRNKIVHLYGDYVSDPVTGKMVEQDDIINKWFIGHAIDQIWDYKTLGIWQQNEAAEAAAYSRSPGDYKLEDVNKDGYYTNADKQFQGYKNPVVRLTFRNVVQYKNLELVVKMYSNLGHYRANNYVRNGEAFYDRSTYYNVPYWTPENPGNTWARIDSYKTGFDVWQNNSFVRIDNVALSYNVPNKFLNKFKIAGCRFSLVSENSYVIAPWWSWMDPEYNDYSPSNLSFKINVTL